MKRLFFLCEMLTCLPSSVLFFPAGTAFAENSSLFPSTVFPPSVQMLPNPNQKVPRYPFLIQRPCPLLPAEVMMGGYAGCPTASDLLICFQKDHCFLSSAFNSYSLYSTRNGKKDNGPSNSGIFFIQDDFPKQAPEIACIIHRYGDGFYKEEIFFFQRIEEHPERWRKIIHFNLGDSNMPWGGPAGGVRVRMIALTPDSIAIPVESVRDGKYCGDIVFRFRMKNGIYRMRALLISEAVPTE